MNQWKLVLILKGLLRPEYILNFMNMNTTEKEDAIIMSRQLLADFFHLPNQFSLQTNLNPPELNNIILAIQPCLRHFGLGHLCVCRLFYYDVPQLVSQVRQSRPERSKLAQDALSGFKHRYGRCRRLDLFGGALRYCLFSAWAHAYRLGQGNRGARTV